MRKEGVPSRGLVLRGQGLERPELCLIPLEPLGSQAECTSGLSGHGQRKVALPIGA